MFNTNRIYQVPLQAVVIGLLLLSHNSFGQISGVDYAWETERDKQGIKIQTSKVDGSDFKAVRGEMVVQGSVVELVALVKDHAYCPNWADLCKESRVIEAVSATEELVYVYNDTPFPVKDRDVVARAFWSKHSKTGKVSMLSRAINADESDTLVPKTRKALRLSKAVSQWHFTPMAEGKTLVESFAHIDPGGPTPAWISNMLLVGSPFETMQNMRSTIESGRYKSAVDLPF